MQPLLVVAAIITRQNKVLLTRRPDDCRYAGFWEFPGGKLLDGESPQSALEREIKEELGIQIQVNSIFEVAYYQYEWGPVLILAFESQILKGILRNLEVAEHRWVAFADLPTYQILPADESIVKSLISLAR